jgi:hypothetical protein
MVLEDGQGAEEQSNLNPCPCVWPKHVLGPTICCRGEGDGRRMRGAEGSWFSVILVIWYVVLYSITVGTLKILIHSINNTKL